ncbi:tetratricopeptide repeat protein [Streptomonospora wellingtoniae]|uniref:Tetratricopeptide repeat protein n=1 Tax=Streptomonospora wellingtoniae TaxID=3075544 RepID=A0ABU2KT44_9ACTN|nr:tetratricopeptide repeat protein [Streptomonospora sp. DSM 45055]MDT0302455.1 tetratricopeptide repeat protein [Streptomonospora sp. DSM 45055]
MNCFPLSISTSEGTPKRRIASMRIRRETGDPIGEATTLNGLGPAHLRSRRLDKARMHFEQSLAIARRFGERRWEGIAWGNLADTLVDLGDRDHWHLAVSLEHLAAALEAAGDEAQQRWDEALGR